MPKGKNQKFKLMYLKQIMQEKTDDEHGLTMQEILEELEKYDVTAERKSIYEDFNDLTDRFGLEILKESRGRNTFYHVGERQFELAEVKLLIDAIQSSKFITEAKSRDLINKIETFVSEAQAKKLQRQIFISDRVKAMNESVYYNVDAIHEAINANLRIRFKYYNWDINKNLVPRHGGDFIEVSPWALTWDDENYYLVAFDAIEKKIKHYRVDKMKSIDTTEELREGKDFFEGFDIASYSKSVFGMYSGEKVPVEIHFANHMCGVFIDRFGKDINFTRLDDEHSRLCVSVNVSPQFFGWIFSLGKDVKVVAPDYVVKDMKDAARDFLANME